MLLKHLILEHHDLFKQLYPDRNLIPKHHFMIHYPACMRKIGPLIHMWSMRFEAKHKVFKNTLKNFKNITKSLAKKHQMAIGYHWETSPLNHVEYGPLKSFYVDNEVGDLFTQAMHGAVPNDIFYTNWVTICGTEYRTGLVVCSKIECEMPVFCKIQKVLLVDSVIYFLVSKLEVDHFSEHFHAYLVFERDEKEVIKAESLVMYKPYDLQNAYGGDESLYIVPLFSL